MVSGVNGALTLTAVKAVEVETKQEVESVLAKLHLKWELGVLDLLNKRESVTLIYVQVS